jgi:cell division septation protein DedD
MRGVFDDREIERAETGREREVTLGSATLLLIFFGLVLLCGLCFGLGYTAGHRGTQDVVAALPPVTSSANQPPNQEQAAAPTDDGQPKPSADALASGAGTQPDAPPNQPLNADAIAAGGGAPSSAIAAGSIASPGTPQVKPAFGSGPTPAQAGSPVASGAGQAPGSANAPAGSFMVQIAAVSQQADADVLMGALRRHGYTVGAQRAPLDGLIHVRIGPFKTSDEAEKWRIKLLNDGYNAVIQQ